MVIFCWNARPEPMMISSTAAEIVAPMTNSRA